MTIKIDRTGEESSQEDKQKTTDDTGKDMQRTIANRITRLIQERFGGNESRFARHIGITPANVNRWRRRHYMPSVEAMFAISRSCQVSISWLMGMGAEVPPMAPVNEKNVRLVEAEEQLAHAKRRLANAKNEVGIYERKIAETVRLIDRIRQDAKRKSVDASPEREAR
jgi:transcriptional regulator with XRE-family HTH domain